MMASKHDELISVQCFGTAWDDTAEECYSCDVSQRCRRLTVSITSKSLPKFKREREEENPLETKLEKEKTSRKLKELLPKLDKEFKRTNGKKLMKVDDEGLPEFSSMTLEDIQELATEHGITFYHPDRKICRMRLIVLIKKKLVRIP